MTNTKNFDRTIDRMLTHIGTRIPLAKGLNEVDRLKSEREMLFWAKKMLAENESEDTKFYGNLFLDLDGVLVDFLGPALVAHGCELSDYPENPPQHWISEHLKLSKSDFWKPLDREFWANLPMLPDAQEILTLCLDFCNGHKDGITILTSPTGNPEASAGKVQWLARNLSGYQFLLGHDKHVCAGPLNVLVDDCNEVVDSFKEFGGNAVLLPRRWNRRYVIASTKESPNNTVNVLKKELAQLKDVVRVNRDKLKLALFKKGIK